MRTFKISGGPTFKGGQAYVGLFLVAIIFLAIIGFLVNYSGITDLLWITGLLGVGFFVLRMACHFEGIEFDMGNDQVRKYTIPFAIRVGKWEKLSDYQEIALKIDRFKVTERQFYNQDDQDFTYNTHSFFILLVDWERQKDMVITDWPNYNDAKENLYALGKQLNYPVKDYFAKELSKAKRSARR